MNGKYDGGGLCEQLLELGRRFELDREKERQHYEDKRRQRQGLIDRQQEKLQLQSDQIMSLQDQLTEIEGQKTRIAKLENELSRSSAMHRKVVRELTYQLVATGFELSDAKHTMKVSAAKSMTNGKKVQKNKENVAPNLSPTKPGGAEALEDNATQGTGQQTPGTAESVGEPTKVAASSKLPVPDSDSDEKVKEHKHSDSALDGPLHSKEMLYYAAQQGLDDLIQKILSPQQNFPDQLSHPLGVALGKACISGNMAIARNLLAFGADIEAVSAEDNFQSPLHIAAKCGRPEMVKLLIDEGANVDALDSSGQNPLFLAASQNQSECAELLLFAGCDTSVKDCNGKTVQELHGTCPAVCDKKLLFWNCCTRGNRIYNQSKHETALYLFEEALRLTKENNLQVVVKDKATIHYNCARAAMRLTRHLLAIEHCTSAIAIDEGFVKAWKLRGENHKKLCNYAQAVTDLEQASKLSSNDGKLFDDLDEARRLRDMDHYTLFNVPVDANPAAIKKRYRKLCLRWHPDKNRKTEDDLHRASNMFRNVQEAHKVLSEPCQRILYDMVRTKSAPGTSLPTHRNSHSQHTAPSQWATQAPQPQPRTSSSSHSAHPSSPPSPAAAAAAAAAMSAGPSPIDLESDLDPDVDFGVFSDLEGSVDYPLVEEDSSDLLHAGDYGDAEFHKNRDYESSSSRHQNDRMWKLFEEYERAYRRT